MKRKILILLLLIAIVMPIVEANFTRIGTAVPEERRVYKIGPKNHFHFHCDSASMGTIINCTETYWAFTPQPGDAQIGDIVAYRPNQAQREYFNLTTHGKIRYIVHRIVDIEIADFEEGEYKCFVFKGDANEDMDPFCVEESQLRYIVLWPEPEPWRIEPMEVNESGRIGAGNVTGDFGQEKASDKELGQEIRQSLSGLERIEADANLAYLYYTGGYCDRSCSIACDYIRSFKETDNNKGSC
jgi:hypothetical protein